MALALYRKYRPATFSEVVGQEHVTEPLMHALASGRINHAYLFSGPRGCGKTSSARILARSLNCETRGPTPDPCGKCDSCVALAPDGPGSLDVIEIDAASHGGVDDARDLRERAFFAPVSSRYKVYIVDEAHMVSPQGFNALLKLVEEPPEFLIFVFATTEPEKVLTTIRSRTHHYPFRLIPPGVMRGLLSSICTAEGIAVEPTVLPLVVRAGGGSARDALSVLDQLIAGSGPEGVTYAHAIGLLGVTDGALLDEMVDALAAGDSAAVYETVDRVVEAGHDPRRYASDLLERLRDLIVLQQVPDAVSKGLLDAPTDQLDRMSTQAARFGPASLSRMADIVHNGLVEMRGTTAPRLLLELVTARMLLPGADDSAGALLHRLERMERRLGAAPSAPEPASTEDVSHEPARSEPAPVVETRPEPPAAPSEPPTPPPVSGAIDASAVRRVWDEVLSIVARKSKRIAALARDATVRDVEGNTVVLVLRHQVHAEMLAATPDLLVEAMYEVFGGSWQIRCTFGGDQRGSTPALVPPQGRTPDPVPPAETDTEWPTPARPGEPEPEAIAPPKKKAPAARKSKAAGRAGTRTQAAPEPAPDGPGQDLYEGFDPGDEPVDEDGTASARQTSEQQALTLLQEAFDAEKIGEVDHR